MKAVFKIKCGVANTGVANKSCYCSQQNYLEWNCRAFRPAMWKLRSDSIKP